MNDLSNLEWLDSLTPEAQQALLKEAEFYLAGTAIEDYDPYCKQQDFHDLGKTFRERLLSAGNQLGKTFAASCEVAYHVTGNYPDWWQGKVFTKANHWLCGSESGELTRRGVQRLLFGRDPKSQLGTGAIKADRIIHCTWARGVADLLDTVSIQHKSGGTSTISLKSYDQGRTKWQADTVDGVWFDEEPPLDVYMEGVTRTNMNLGPIMLTFTPLKGMSQVVARFLVDKYPGTTTVFMGIEDVDHYTDEQKAAIIASYPEHERDARTRGIPALGSGKVFPVNEKLFVVQPFQVPSYWPAIGGLDFGWDHPSAAAKLVWDKDSDCIYVTQEYRASEQTPIQLAAAVKPWGTWLPWAWPHDGLQHDKGSGEQLASLYKKAGLAMLKERATFEDGSNGLEAGIVDMLERMQTGRWKVFSTCTQWLEESRMYHRKDGLIVKERDDLISASRYAYMMRRYAKTRPVDVSSQIREFRPSDAGTGPLG